MKNLATIRERYLRDPLPIRLGGLAADLARIASFSDHPDHLHAVSDLLEESKFFVEWVVPETKIEVQGLLVELQIQLALWHRALPKTYANRADPQRMAQQARAWSERILEEMRRC